VRVGCQSKAVITGFADEECLPSVHVIDPKDVATFDIATQGVLDFINTGNCCVRGIMGSRCII
jgi:hypothetical protein